MEEKSKDIEHFNSIGKNASNVYYVNQDRKDKQKADLKGDSRKVIKSDGEKKICLFIKRN